MPQEAAVGPDPGPGGPWPHHPSDGWRGCDGLVDRGYKKHFRVNHGQHEFARGNYPINGIESFWLYAKRRRAKFNVFHEQLFIYT